MDFDLARMLGQTGQGALAGGMTTGGPWGAVIGGGLGALSSLFGGGGDDAIQQQLQLYKDLMAQYTGPDADQLGAMGKLQQMANTNGLLPEERTRMMQAAIEANQMAQSREQAIAMQGQQMGQGRSTSGQTAAMQQQAADAGTQRYALAAQGAAGQASQRQQAALNSYLAEKDRTQQMLNSYRMAAASGQAGALNNLQGYNEAKGEANAQNFAGLANNVTGVGMYAAKNGGFGKLFGGGGGDGYGTSSFGTPEMWGVGAPASKPGASMANMDTSSQWRGYPSSNGYPGANQSYAGPRQQPYQADPGYASMWGW